MAAAKQAALLGMRGIAFSTPTGGKEPDFEALHPWVARVLGTLLDDESHELVNVNLPPEPKGLRWARQSVRHYDGKVVPGKDPMGREHFWFTIKPLESPEENTDRWAMEHGYVSLTPVRLDLTDEEQLSRMQAEHPVD